MGAKSWIKWSKTFRKRLWPLRCKGWSWSMWGRVRIEKGQGRGRLWLTVWNNRWEKFQVGDNTSTRLELLYLGVIYFIFNWTLQWPPLNGRRALDKSMVLHPVELQTKQILFFILFFCSYSCKVLSRRMINYLLLSCEG